MTQPIPDSTPNLLSFDEDGVQFAWDSTSLGNYEKCPRYYQLTNLQGLRSNITSPHLFFGGVYASALEHFFKHQALGMSREDAILKVVTEVMEETWEYDHDEDGEPIPNSGKPWDSLHNTKTRETLVRSIVWYFEHFADDQTDTIILDNGDPAVEYSFALPLDDGLVYCGHIDRLVTYGDDIYVMDQKTTGAAISAYYFKQFTPDIQMSGYTYAGKILFNLPVKGVIIDAAQVMVGFTRFGRSFIHRSEANLNEWLDHSMHHIERAREDTKRGFFPMNLQSCGNYGGCVFRESCGASPDHRKRLLAADFTPSKRWDPLERR